MTKNWLQYPLNLDKMRRLKEEVLLESHHLSRPAVFSWEKPVLLLRKPLDRQTRPSDSVCLFRSVFLSNCICESLTYMCELCVILQLHRAHKTT